MRVGVEEVQVSDDNADFLENEGLEHVTTHQSCWPGAAHGIAVFHYHPASDGRLAVAGVT
jgi:hypothetical protein